MIKAPKTEISHLARHIHLVDVLVLCTTT